MGIVFDKNKKFIVDRTLPQIIKKLYYISKDDIEYFLKLLEEVGIDFFEIDKVTLDIINELPLYLNYIYRVNSETDLKYLNKCKFKYIVMDYITALKYSSDLKSKLKDNKIILEIDVNDIDDLYLDENNQLFNIYNIDFLRIGNVLSYNLFGGEQLIRDIKTHFSVLIDFCANDKYHMATAATINACSDGTDMITTVFNGQGFAPMEEVILALKVIKNARICGNLKLINELTKVYKKLMKKEIYSMKPVLGEDIFKYESGIHADGIAKNPKNYEPFDPEDIGTHRTLYIGKHSGKKALEVKLQELNLNYENINMDTFLKKIRSKSIEIKRNIFDDEIIKMYNSFKNFFEGDD